MDLDNELNRNDETRNGVVFEDDDFPASKHQYDRREHAHHRKSKIGKKNWGLKFVEDWSDLHQIKIFSVLSKIREILVPKFLETFSDSQFWASKRSCLIKTSTVVSTNETSELSSKEFNHQNSQLQFEIENFWFMLRKLARRNFHENLQLF